jgi:DNA-binding NtrC family response regulator
MCVDDDKAFLSQFISRVLQLDSSIEFSVAHGFSEAQALMGTFRPDLVLLDLDLQDPMGGGYELIEFAHLKSIGVVVFSQFDDIETITKIVELRVLDFMSKATAIPECVVRIKMAMKKHLQSLMFDRPSKVKLVAEAPAMRSLFKKVQVLAQSSSLNVVILGETGTGKDVVAQAINAENQRGRNFISLNCAAIPEAMAESILFGHEQGAFTGASRSVPGKFELAHEGDLFLDEVATLSLSVQAKLLRVIETKQVERLGSSRMRPANVRVIAATNEGIHKMIEKGSFRQDLYERLAGMELVVPPLRERREEILPLVDFFLKQLGRGGLKLSSETQKIFKSYTWPGNIRELRQVVSVMQAFAEGEILTPELLPPKIMRSFSSREDEVQTFDGGYLKKWDEVERDFFVRYIKDCVRILGHKVSVRGLAAVSGIPRSTLGKRLKMMSLEIPQIVD